VRDEFGLLQPVVTYKKLCYFHHMGKRDLNPCTTWLLACVNSLVLCSCNMQPGESCISYDIWMLKVDNDGNIKCKYETAIRFHPICSYISSELLKLGTSIY
jgi:hypothetical protein